MSAVRLKPGREKSVLRNHPWVFSGAIAKNLGEPQIGDTVEVQDSFGNFLAWGAYSPHSQIRARIWSWTKDTDIDRQFFYRRLSRAIEMRKNLFERRENGAYRLVHGESDFLPGLIVDQYGAYLVVQFLSAGVERWRDVLVEALLDLTEAKGIYERSDVDVRTFEGLGERTGLLVGGEPPKHIQIIENGLRFWVDIREGHKTGAYLDQRKNRELVMARSGGLDVLDCFCYSGGFSLHALKGGAKSIVAVDSSETSLDLARSNLALNDYSPELVTLDTGDVFKLLRLYRDQARQFDMIILDPPKFAQTASQAQRAARGYKDINLLALKLLRAGGWLFTFSCSGGVGADLFQKIVAGAVQDAGVDAQIVDWMHQSGDHPVALSFPEGAYLKGLVVRVV